MSGYPGSGVHNCVGTPLLGTPRLGTPRLGTPGLGTPGLGTPGLGAPCLGIPNLSTTGLDTFPHTHRAWIHQLLAMFRGFMMARTKCHD